MNDASIVAQFLPFGETLTGTSASIYDYDWFAVEVAGAGSITLKFQAEGTGGSKWVYSLVGPTHEELGSLSCTGTPCSTEVQQLIINVIATGTYYVRVHGDWPYPPPTDPYQITVDFEAAADALEVEPNDQTAQVISLGDLLLGALSGDDDVDRFEVTVEAAGLLTFKLEGPPVNLGWALRVLDAADNLIHSARCSPCGPSDGTTAVGLAAAGSYTVELSRDLPHPATLSVYALTVEFDRVTGPVELEPNNNSLAAQFITDGEVLEGASASVTDEDWFMLSVPGPGRVTMRLLTSEPRSRGWTFGLVDPAGNLLAASYCAYAFCRVEAEELTTGVSVPGIYHLWVRPDGTEPLPSGRYLVSASYSTVEGGLELEPNDVQAQPILLEEPIVGTLSSLTDIDLYRLDLQTPGQLRVRFNARQSELLSIIDAAGNVLAGCIACVAIDPGAESVAELVVGIPLADTYFLRVTGGYQTPYRNYDLVAEFLPSTAAVEFEPNDTMVAPQPIEAGESIRGSLWGIVDEDWYQIDVPGAGGFSVELANEVSNRLNVEVVDATGHLLASLCCGGRQFTTGFTGPATYFLRLYGASTPRTYEFTTAFDAALTNLEVEPNDTVAQSIGLNQEVTGTFKSEVDVDLYAINLLAPGRLTLHTSSASGIWQLELLDADGNLLATSCSSRCDAAAGVTTGIAREGTYFVRVTPINVFLPSYTFSLSFAEDPAGAEFEPNNDQEYGQPIVPEEPVIGNLSSTLDVDWYSVNVEAPGILTLSLQPPDAAVSDTGWRYSIHDASGALLIATQCVHDCGEAHRQISVGLGSAGIYSVRVDAAHYRVPSVDYEITVSIAPNIDGVELEPNDELAQSIALDDTIAGSLWSSEDIDTYAVTAPGPGRLTLELDASLWGEEVQLQVLDESGDALARGSCVVRFCTTYTGDFSVGLSAGGTYYIRVISEFSRAAPVAAYSFTTRYLADSQGLEVEPNNTHATAGTTGRGELIRGYLQAEGDEDWYAISLEGAARLTGKFTGKESSVRWHVRIEDADGEVYFWISCDGSCIDLPIDLGVMRAGIYYLVVSDSHQFPDPDGEYSFTLQIGDTAGTELEPNNEAGQATYLVAGETLTGTLLPTDETDWFTFETLSTGRLILSLGSEEEFNEGVRYLLYDAELQRIASGDCYLISCPSTGGLDLELPAGRYYIWLLKTTSYWYETLRYSLNIDFSPAPAVPTAVQNVRASQGASQHEVVIEWDRNPPGTSYLVFRSGAQDGTYAEIGHTSDVIYRDQSAKPDTVYYYQVVARNISGRSLPSEGVTGFLASGPRPIANLAVLENTPDLLQLAWTAPAALAAPGGSVERYEILYSPYPMTAATFENATRLTLPLVPAPPGQEELFALDQLLPATRYWIAVRSYSQDALVSTLSNILVVTTAPVIEVNPFELEFALDGNEPVDVTLQVRNLSLTQTLSIAAVVRGVAATPDPLGDDARSLVQASKALRRLPDPVPTDIDRWVFKLAGALSQRDLNDFEHSLVSLGATPTSEVSRERLQTWKLPVNQRDSFESVIAFLGSDVRLLYAEPQYPLSLRDLPLDARFGELWALQNTGQECVDCTPASSAAEVGVVDADIDADEAWDIGRGSRDVVVAVFDSGIDVTHPDLAQNLWRNPGEISGNGIDDDNNGYVDDIHGWNFCSDSNDLTDADGHGTHVAGTIGAVSNDVGVVGVSPLVSIMTLKILDSNTACGDDSYIQIQRALKYAADNGASVMNHSWGCNGQCAPSNTVNEGIEYTEARGLLFVHAAGNAALNTDYVSTVPWSDSLASVVSVTATGRDDKLAAFANVGRNTVDLGAPGIEILSTTPGGEYTYLSGTSMASPHVTGAAALLKALDPTLKASGMKSLLMGNTDPMSGLATRTVSGGRLNAARSMRALVPAWMYITGGDNFELLPGAVAEVTLRLDPGGLSRRTYVGRMDVSFSGRTVSRTSVPVTLRLGSVVNGVFLATPQNLTVTNRPNASYLSLTWDPSPGAESYLVQRSELVDTAYEDLGIVAVGAFDDTTMLPERQYYYRVIAQYSAGSSLPSEPAAGQIVGRFADIELSTTSPLEQSVVSGESTTMHLTYHNHGPDDITQAIVRAVLPPGLSMTDSDTGDGECREFGFYDVICDLGTVGSGEERQLRLVVTAGAVGSFLLNITATSAVIGPVDRDLSNNTIVFNTVSLDPFLIDTDRDGIVDAIDTDDDGDGIPDIDDAFPRDATNPASGIASRLQNLSARGFVGTSDNVLIGGLIITGTEPKTVVIRARGPSLRDAGVTGSLADPEMTLFSGATVIDSNDSWETHPGVHLIPDDLRPTAYTSEAVIATTLSPGAYTAIVGGKDGSTGIGLVEIFEVGDTGGTRLQNIATRGFVDTGDGVLIGGLVIAGTEPKKVVIRAKGPSLAGQGVSGTLANPRLAIFSGASVIKTNDDWDSEDNTDKEKIPVDLRPTNSLEATVYLELPPGPYTAIVDGSGGGTGVGIVEVFEVLD
ncbi:MAG: S8 family serine peptidase [Pseudomonadota bacterium]